KAAPYLKRMVLELGGQNPLIVLADAELEYAVNATAFGTFLHQGQICMSARRIIVERSIAKEFTDRLVAKTKGLKVGSPTEPDTIRSEEHTSELQSPCNLVCRLLLEKKKL